MGLLGQKAVSSLIFWGNSILFSTVAAREIKGGGESKQMGPLEVGIRFFHRIREKAFQGPMHW